MFKGIAAVVLVIASAASAQDAVSFRTDNPTPKRGDPNKIVCETQEKIGTRLGGKKVCMTVSEWEERRAANRQIVEAIQMGTRAPCEQAGNPSCM